MGSHDVFLRDHQERSVEVVHPWRRMPRRSAERTANRRPIASSEADQTSTRNPTSMTASWGILKKSGARLAIRLRNEKIANAIGLIDDPVSRRTMVSCAI